MEPPRDDQLIADLEALRPAPRPQFAAELDERVAAGFPRRSRLPRLSLGRLRAVPPKRLLLPAGAFALLAIAVVTALGITTDESRTGSGSMLSYLDESGVEEVTPESEAVAPAGAGAGRLSGAAPGTGSAAVAPPPGRRAVERSAAIVLATGPDDLADDTADVFEAVHAHNGIVMRSATREGTAGEAGASFELLIPTGRLGDAMAAFSRIAEVRSRQEATADITAPTVSARELLEESRARIDSLLAQLQEADTEAEREAVEAELRHERRRAGRLAARLDRLHRRADLSRVSLQIETGALEESSGGAWGIDEALSDAGQVLTVAAAVTVVVVAILGPVALIAFLAWLSHRAWLHRGRRRVLG